MSGFVSGIFIALGTVVYLSILAIGEGSYLAKIIGSLFFGVGLFWVLIYDTWLYTGKVGHLFKNKPIYALDLLFCAITNFLGIIFFCFLVSLTRIADPIKEEAMKLVQAKQNDTWYSILILSILCGMVIYISVRGYTICKSGIGKVLSCFLGISLFIICGFENVFANAGYYMLAGYFSPKAFLYFVLMVLGNGIGAIVIDSLLRITTHLEEHKKNEENK